MNSPGNGAILDSWRLSLHSKRPRTVELYLDIARRFARWLEKEGRPADCPGDLLAVTRRDAEAWFGAMRDQGLAPATMRSRWIALRNLYGWLADEDEVEANPLEKVKVPKPEPPPIPVITDEEISALLVVCKGSDFNSRRDYALVRFLAATGLRVSEACAITAEDLDLPNRLVVIRDGKGGKARVTRFDPATAAALDRYKRVRARHRCAALPDFWIGHRGALTRKGVPTILRRRSREAGIRDINAHALRHLFAHRWLRGGGSEGDLQRLGGWEDPSVMRRYGSALAVDRALAAYDNIDPMAGV